MTSKRVKAWAIMGKRGNLVFDADEQAVIYRRRKTADEAIEPEYFPGERVVRVTIIVEES